MMKARTVPRNDFDWKGHALELRRENARLRREKRLLADLAEMARQHLDDFTAQEQRRLRDAQHQLEGTGHAVRCPHCHATRNFLVFDGGSMLRVLEDAEDTELLEEGRSLVCENCGEILLCPALPVAATA